MTFFDISNRLAVKHKKRISRLDGATYPKFYRPILEVVRGQYYDISRYLQPFSYPLLVTHKLRSFT